MRVRTYYVKCRTEGCGGEVTLETKPSIAFLTPKSVLTLRCPKCRNAYEYGKSDLWNKMSDDENSKRED